jgi:hypothetical protein
VVGPISRYLDVLARVLVKSAQGGYADLPLDVLLKSPYEQSLTRAIGALVKRGAVPQVQQADRPRPAKRRRVSILVQE